MNSNIVATPKRTVLRRKHVLWAINRENPSTGSTWAHAREKIQYNQVTNQEKSHKAVIFHLSGEKPRWMDWNENLHRCRSRGGNHGRQVQIWKISGSLMSLDWASKFALSHWLCTWALPQCSAAALLVIMHILVHNPFPCFHGLTSLSGCFSLLCNTIVRRYV